MVKRHGKEFKPLSTHQHKPLLRSDLQSLFIVEWSSVGSNKREEEEDTIYFWEMYLKKIEGAVCVMTFVQYRPIKCDFMVLQQLFKKM